MAERISKIIKDHGEEIVLKVRTAGARSATDGNPAITYTDNAVQAYISPPLVRRIEVGGMAATEETRTIFTTSSISFQDLVECDAGTFMIDEKPQEIYKRQHLMYRIARIIKVVSE